MVSTALTPAVSPPPRAGALRDAAPVAYTPKHLAERILRTRDAFEGERKQVTVLFADVSGFTAMSERLDPEEVHSIMDRAFEVILDAVHLYEGTVNQFLGDGVMALFGAPIAHEDHAHRALRAALAIQDGLSPLKREIRRRHRVKFRVRMGLNTGRVVVGAIGRDLRMDYTAVGDTTNLAARLLGIAGPGQIVVSTGTRRPTQGFFTFEDLGEFALKGKSAPVHAYALLGEIRGRTRLEVSRERGLTPLVGRESELRRLTDAYQRAAAGEGTIVLLTGEPGAGKSRVLYELLHRIEMTGPIELEATCASHGRGMPFHPVLQLCRSYLGLGDGLEAEATRARIGERLGALGLEGEEAFTLLAHFLGLPAPPEFLARLGGAQLKERTFATLRAMLLRASAATPVVLVVENLHWIDASSDEFLQGLAADVPRHRVLLLLSARPEAAPSWVSPPLADTVALEGLGEDEVRTMLRNLLGAHEVSPPLLEALLAKGEGNPLYVEELLRRLQETGGVVVEDGEARLRAASVLIPMSIHDIIAARIDQLGEPVKHTLQVAAVVGREFPLTLLERTVETAESVRPHLDELRTLEFVFPKTLGTESVYSFKHALTQEVAYGGLLERRRRFYHAAVGAALEALHAAALDEVVELLAHHYGRSGDDERAVDYAIRAAEKAQHRWANTEALAQFDAALKRLDGMDETTANRLRKIDAVVKQAEVKFALGRQAEHVEALEAIRDVVEAAADPPRRAAWHYWTGFFHSFTGVRPEVSIAHCREAVAIADAGGFDELRAFAECCLAHVLLIAGDLRGALTNGERALVTFEAHGNAWWACRTMWALIPAANFIGEWDRSLRYCRQVLDHGQAMNDLRLKVVGWWRTGSTHIQRGDTATGLHCCDEALALSPIPYDVTMIKAVRGNGLIKAGQRAEGIAALEEAVAWFAESHLRYSRSQFALWLIEGHLAHGGRERARALLDEVLATSREVGYRHLEGVAERLLGTCLADENPGAAAQHLDAALAILEEVGSRIETAKTLTAQADLRRAAGDLGEARRLLERALEIFEALGTVDEPPRVRAALASLTGAVTA